MSQAILSMRVRQKRRKWAYRSSVESFKETKSEYLIYMQIVSMTHLLSVHCDAYICYPTQFMMLCPLHEEIKSMRQKSWLIGNISPSGRLPKQRYVGCGNRRSLERSRIDAICINQNDRTEKLFQLSLMIKIYEQTHLVCVWLREETEGSTIAIEKLKRMNTSSKNRFPNAKNWANTGNLLLPSRHQFFVQSTTRNQSLQWNTTNRTYFKRSEIKNLGTIKLPRKSW